MHMFLFRIRLLPYIGGSGANGGRAEGGDA